MYHFGHAIDPSFQINPEKDAVVLGVALTLLIKSPAIIRSAGKITRALKTASATVATGTADNIARIGDRFGKSGTLVNNPGTRVDWSRVSSHGLQRMSQRGVTQDMVNSWVRSGKVLEQAGGSKHLFFTQQGAVVVATDGTAVTAIPASMYDAAYKALSQALFGS